MGKRLKPVRACICCEATDGLNWMPRSKTWSCADEDACLQRVLALMGTDQAEQAGSREVA